MANNDKIDSVDCCFNKLFCIINGICTKQIKYLRVMNTWFNFMFVQHTRSFTSMAPGRSDVSPDFHEPG